MICALAKRTAIGHHGLLGELLKGLADEGELDTFGKLHHITVAVWGGVGVSQRLKDATVKVLHMKKDRTKCGSYRGISLVAHAGKVLFKVIARTFCRKNSVGSDPSADMMFVLRRLEELAREEDTPLYVFIYLPYQSTCLRRPNPSVGDPR